MPNQILHPSINIPIIPDEGKTEKYPYQLEAEVIDEPNFEEVTGALFQELISPTSGIGVSRFFELYNNLKSIIPGGTLTLTLSSSLTFSDIINSLQIAAERGDSRVFLNELETLVNNVYLTTAISVGTPYSSDVNTHAYLVSSSLPLTYGNLNDQLKVVLTTVGELFGVSSSLSTQLGDTLNRIDLLKANNDQLQLQLDAYQNKLPSGFQVMPDVITMTPLTSVRVSVVERSGTKPFSVYAIGTPGLVSAKLSPRDLDNGYVFIISSGVVEGNTYVKFVDSSTPPASEVVWISVQIPIGVSGVSGVSGVRPGALDINIPRDGYFELLTEVEKTIIVAGLTKEDGNLQVTFPSNFRSVDWDPVKGIGSYNYINESINMKLWDEGSTGIITLKALVGTDGKEGSVTISTLPRAGVNIDTYVYRSATIYIKVGYPNPFGP